MIPTKLIHCEKCGYEGYIDEHENRCPICNEKIIPTVKVESKQN